MRNLESTTLALAIVLLATPAAALTLGQSCEKQASTALRTCGKSIAKQELKCLRTTGAACAPNDVKIALALARLEDKVLDACPLTSIVADAGYPALMTPAGLVDRLEEACVSATASLAARSFGGPHAAARAAASEDGKDCLDDAFSQGRKMMDYALVQQSKCVLAAHAGKTCAPAEADARIAARAAKTASTIAKQCDDLASLVTLAPATFVSRATDQAECLVAAAHGGTAPLDLACGPRTSVPVPARATPMQVVLENDVWGTRCGDGSRYAFWIRLAPAGQPVGNVVVFMVGGGNCVDGPTCAATSADLFESEGDGMGQSGINSSSAATSPFVNWTKVFLPYCTQDLHTGGGVTNVFPEMTVHRYGARNVRAALRYARDVLWGAMDGADAEGFRPDRLRVVLSGSSAGGGGATFNYHYVLDDLRWTHTTLVPDSALGMDNGTGAPALRGALALQATSPGWNALPYAAPYCFAPECAELFTHLDFATTPRLKATPEQQILHVSNQTDNVQRNVGEFTSTPHFVNTLRSEYCGVRGAPGIHAFFYDSTAWIHGMIGSNPDYNNDAIDGVRLRDWLGSAMASPDSVTDRIGLGTLEDDFPGVQPFPCDVED